MPTILRFALAGSIQAVVIMGLWLGLLQIASLLFPDLMNSMASLLFEPLVITISLVLAFGGGIAAAYFYLKPVLAGYPRVMLIILPFLSVGTAIIARNLAYPHNNIALMAGSIVVAMAASYAFVGAVGKRPGIYATTLVILATVISFAFGAAGFSDSTKAIHRHGLKDAGFTLYVAPEGSPYTILSATPVSGSNNADFSKDVQFRIQYTLAGETLYTDLYEFKRPAANPTTSCGTEYLYPYSYFPEGNDQVRCELIANENGMALYKQSETYENVNGEKHTTIHYFALKGGTLIFAGINDDTQGQKLNDTKTIDFIESLQPITDKYIDAHF